MLTIGHVARQTGLTAKAVRLYETLGLIDPPVRTASDYRIYEPEHLPVLRFIRRAQLLGLPLKDIKNVLDAHHDGRSPCPLVTHLLDMRLAETEHRISELQALRDSLHVARALATRAPDRHAEEADVSTMICPLIEETAASLEQQGRPGAQGH
ncbi:MerR family DNA-binding protein [Streptomyces sp. NPDC059866]|uniref:MerR family DNA-binding protein n=1 Tax=Streptomyces sp. NPDC059866 TaxID=3346978 RepID=UPI00364E7521